MRSKDPCSWRAKSTLLVCLVALLALAADGGKNPPGRSNSRLQKAEDKHRKRELQRRRQEKKENGGSDDDTPGDRLEPPQLQLPSAPPAKSAMDLLNDTRKAAGWHVPVLFHTKFKCSDKAMKYTIHGGWGNQVAGLRRALLLAVILNRTLIVPPVMSHSQMAYGKCARHMSAGAHKMRQNAQHLYPKISGHTGSSSLDLFDHDRLDKAVRTVGWSQWERQCSNQVQRGGEDQVRKVNHDCAAALTNTEYKWVVPADVHIGPSGNSSLFLNEPWGDENRTKMPASYYEFGERVSELRKVDSTLLHFGTLFPASLYTNDFLGVTAHIITKYLVYHPSLWEIPCQIARQAAPFATIHVRGGDGIFKKRGHFLKSVRKQIAAVTEHFSTEQMQRHLQGISEQRAALSGPCGEKEKGKQTVRLMLITDLKWSLLEEKMETNLTDFGKTILEVTDRLGWAVKTATTRTGAGARAIAALKQVPRVMAHPKTFVPLVLDIMLGVLSDAGFAGSPDSTLSRHVVQMRAAFDRDMLCAAHDAKAAEEKEAPVCPGQAESDFDKEVFGHPTKAVLKQMAATQAKRERLLRKANQQANQTWQTAAGRTRKRKGS